MHAIWSFDGMENRYDVCRGECCMKKGCEPFRDHAFKIINFEKKKMIPLTNKQQGLYENTKICCICKKIFEHKCTNNNPCHYTSIYRCNLCLLYMQFKIQYIQYIPKNIPVVFHNRSKYDDQFIIIELAKKFDEGLNCLGENAGQSKDDKSIDKNGKEVTKTISYRLQFIDNVRFMASPLSNSVGNFSNEMYKDKCKNEQNNKKCKVCEI